MSETKAEPTAAVMSLSEEKDEVGVQESKEQLSGAVVSCNVCLEEVALENALVNVCTSSLCQGVACRDCFTAYASSVVNSSYDGVCFRMKCFGCPRVIPYGVWSAIVTADLAEAFTTHARKLMSIQCGGCHTRKDVFVDYNAEEKTANTNLLEGLFVDSQGKDEFLGEILPKYYTDDLKVNDVYEALQQRVNADNMSEAVSLLLRIMEDPERRSIFHLRHIRFVPRVVTKCCKVDHCFRCKTRGFHQGKTCDEFMASRTNEEMVTCPACGMFLVKGDGCNSVSCVCSRSFNWATRVREMKQILIDTFTARFGGREEAGKQAARMILSPWLFETEDVTTARQMETLASGDVRMGRSNVWEELRGRFALQRAVVAERQRTAELGHEWKLEQLVPGLEAQSSQDVGTGAKTLARSFVAEHSAEVNALQEQGTGLKAGTWAALVPPGLDPAVEAMRHVPGAPPSCLARLLYPNMQAEARAFAARLSQEAKAAATDTLRKEPARVFLQRFGNDVGRAAAVAARSLLLSAHGLEGVHNVEAYAFAQAHEVDVGRSLWEVHEQEHKGDGPSTVGPHALLKAAWERRLQGMSLAESAEEALYFLGHLSMRSRPPSLQHQPQRASDMVFIRRLLIAAKPTPSLRVDPGLHVNAVLRGVVKEWCDKDEHADAIRLARERDAALHDDMLELLALGGLFADEEEEEEEAGGAASAAAAPSPAPAAPAEEHKGEQQEEDARVEEAKQPEPPGAERRAEVLDRLSVGCRAS